MLYGTLSQPDVRVTIAERDMELHRPIPTLVKKLTGIGSYVCLACGERWRGRGCQPYRDARVFLLTYAARMKASRPSLQSVRPAEDHYRWREPVGRTTYRTTGFNDGTRTGRHRERVAA